MFHVVPDLWGTLLKRGLRFVQRRHTRNSVKMRDPICAWTNEIAQHQFSSGCLSLLYNAKDAASFYSGLWNTGTNPDLAFASVGPNSRLPDIRVLKSFSGHNIDLRLLHHQGLLWQCQVCLLSDGTSARQNGVTTLLWQVNSQRLCFRLIHLMWMRLTRTSVTSSRKQPKRLPQAGIEIIIFRTEMRGVNLSIECSCSLLRGTKQVWLLQLCVPSLTGSGGIDGPRQFGASTSTL